MSEIRTSEVGILWAVPDQEGSESSRKIQNKQEYVVLHVSFHSCSFSPFHLAVEYQSQEAKHSVIAKQILYDRRTSLVQNSSLLPRISLGSRNAAVACPRESGVGFPPTSRRSSTRPHLPQARKSRPQPPRSPSRAQQDPRELR